MENLCKFRTPRDSIFLVLFESLPWKPIDTIFRTVTFCAFQVSKKNIITSMLTVTMSVIKNCVLLLKSQKTDENYDKYEELLKQSGYSVRQLKTLTFKYQNLEVLSEKLAIPENYSGIIFSSPRCVHSVHLALNGEGLDVRWKSNANFVVGEATFDAAKSKLGLICKGSETGNAENLAELIIKGMVVHL